MNTRPKKPKLAGQGPADRSSIGRLGEAAVGALFIIGATVQILGNKAGGRGNAGIVSREVQPEIYWSIVMFTYAIGVFLLMHGLRSKDL